MNISKLSFLFVTLLLILAGCQSLPPGTPPEGPIVEINQKNDSMPVTPKQATNIMVTAIATSSPLGTDSIPPNIELVNDKYPSKLSVLKGLLAMNMVNFNPTLRFDYRLYSIFTNSPSQETSKFHILNWQLFLITLPQNKLIWKHAAKIKIPIENNEYN